MRGLMMSKAVYYTANAVCFAVFLLALPVIVVAMLGMKLYEISANQSLVATKTTTGLSDD